MLETFFIVSGVIMVLALTVMLIGVATGITLSVYNEYIKRK